MLRMFVGKRRVAALVTSIAVLAMAGAAVAYFTSTGSTTGTATVGNATSTWKVATGTTTGPALVPDGSIGVTTLPSGAPSLSFATGSNVQTVPYTVTNTSAGSVNLANVAISLTGLPSGCPASDFSIDGNAVGATANDTSLDGDFAAGALKSGDATVELIDNGANQNNCENATITLTLNAS